MLENQKNDPNHSQEHLTATTLAQYVDATASISAESTIEQNQANIIPRTSNDNQMNDHSQSLAQIK